jgi:hypothetical protein
VFLQTPETLQTTANLPSACFTTFPSCQEGIGAGHAFVFDTARTTRTHFSHCSRLCVPSG